MNFILLLIALDLLLFGYELIILNEEFFIAFVFFCFFFAAYPIFRGLIYGNFKDEHYKLLVVSEEIFSSKFSFLINYVNTLFVYELNKEFIYSYANFLLDSIFFKFLSFSYYMQANKRIPLFLYSFIEKLFNFVLLRVQDKLLVYFLNKWKFLVVEEVLLFSDKALEEDNTSWTYKF